MGRVVQRVFEQAVCSVLSQRQRASDKGSCQRRDSSIKKMSDSDKPFDDPCDDIVGSSLSDWLKKKSDENDKKV